MADITIVRPSVLTKCADILRKAIKSKAPTKRIREGIRVGYIRQTSGGGISIQVSVKAPEARAYEFGSGLHATKGPRMKYPIRPRLAKSLYFYWERMGVTFVGKQVMHPGVEARPYIAPSVKETRKEIRGLISQDAKQNIRLYIRKSFNTKSDWTGVEE